MSEHATPRRTWITVVVVVALCAVGLGGYRWWNSAAKRADRSLSQVRELPGVRSASYNGDEGERRVVLAPSASSQQVLAVMDALHADTPDGVRRDTVLVGRASAVLPDDDSFDERLAERLDSLGEVDLEGAGIRVNTSDIPTVDVTVPGNTTISAARAVLRGLESRPETAGRWINVQVEQRGDSAGSSVSLTRKQGVDLGARLAGLAPLQQWKPDITLGPIDNVVQLHVARLADVPAVHRKAATAGQDNVELDVFAGGNKAAQVAFVGWSDPAEAIALVHALQPSRVSSVNTDLSRVQLSTSLADLPAAAATLRDHGVETADIGYDGPSTSGRILADPASVGRAAPAVAKLDRAGYGVNWVATDHKRGNDGPAITVDSTNGTHSNPLAEQDHGVAVMKLIRGLGWHGKAALCFPSREASDADGVYFISSATGHFGGASGGDGSELQQLTDAWDAAA